jgi:hypothetical protein
MFFLFSCAHAPKTPKPSNYEDLVSLEAALNQAQASYLKGCVDAMKSLHIPVSFPGCRDKSLLHRQELDSIMSQDL